MWKIKIKIMKNGKGYKDINIEDYKAAEISAVHQVIVNLSKELNEIRNTIKEKESK